MITPEAVMKPEITGCDRKLARKPSFRNPIAVSMMPESSASAIAAPIYSGVPWDATSPTAAPVISETTATGPTASARDALEIARRNPDREVVFFGLGFETTTPSTALSIQQAAREELSNFSVFCNHITVPPPIKALLDDPHMILDGFVGPGHVSMVIGVHPYDFIAEEYGKPLVVAGFEPLDLLQSVLMVLEQIRDGRAQIENQYARVVPEHGNAVSLAAIADVYEERPSFEWRGLGEIDASGLRIRDAYAAFDAEVKFQIGYGAGPRHVEEPEGCACGAVMTGRMKPVNCPQFGLGCTPEMPLGALMVSSEGACAAYYQYGGARAVEAAE